MFTATYSPDDNNLRLYSTARLDAETFASLKGAGFIWAARQAEQLRPLVRQWEDLPAGTFTGTDVRAALVVIEAFGPVLREGRMTMDANADRSPAHWLSLLPEVGSPGYNLAGRIRNAEAAIATAEATLAAARCNLANLEAKALVFAARHWTEEKIASAKMRAREAAVAPQ